MQFDTTISFAYPQELELLKHVQPTAMHPALQAISLLRYI